MFIDTIIAQKDFKITAIISSTKDFAVAQINLFKEKFEFVRTRMNYTATRLMIAEFKEMYVFVSVPYEYPEKDLRELTAELCSDKVMVDDKIMELFSQVKKNLS